MRSAYKSWFKAYKSLYGTLSVSQQLEACKTRHISASRRARVYMLNWMDALLDHKRDGDEYITIAV